MFILFFFARAVAVERDKLESARAFHARLISSMVKESQTRWYSTQSFTAMLSNDEFESRGPMVITDL